MKLLLYSYLLNSFTVSFFLLLLFFSQNFIKRRLSTVCLYRAWIILLLALLIPLRPSFSKAIVTFDLPRILNEHEATYSTNSIKNGATPLEDANDVNTEADNLPNSNTMSVRLQTKLVNLLTQPIKETCNLLQLLCYLWISGIFLMLIKNFGSYLLLKHRLMKWCRSPLSLEDRFVYQTLTTNYHIKHLRICYCNILHTPLTYGLIHPTILLPSRKFTSQELSYLLEHEFIHIKRRDCLIKLLMTIVQSIYWFHPFVYLLSYELDALCEQSCDYLVLKNRNLSERTMYGTLLLTIASNSLPPTGTLSTNFYGGKQNMKLRLHNIVDQEKKHSGLLFLIAFLAILSTTTIFSLNTSNTASANETSRDLLHENTPHLSSIDLPSSNLESKNSNSINSNQGMSYTLKISPAKLSKERKDLVAYANKQEHAPYAYRGSDLRKGVDCSGFVYCIYKKFDYDLPRTSAKQFDDCTSITKDELLPGDLIFYASDDVINHVAIYLGNDKIIHSKNPRVGVIIEEIQYRTPYMYGRIFDK